MTQIADELKSNDIDVANCQLSRMLTGRAGEFALFQHMISLRLRRQRRRGLKTSNSHVRYIDCVGDSDVPSY